MMGAGVPSPSEVNSSNISLLMEHFAKHIGHNDPTYFCNLCFSLASTEDLRLVLSAVYRVVRKLSVKRYVRKTAFGCGWKYYASACIDFAIANYNVPSKAQDLPLLMKQICQKKNSDCLKAAIMVLMISVKNACKMGWFLDNEADELNSLANEIGSDFFGDMNTGQSGSLSTITSVMKRFYPQMKMGQIFASLEVKPGYGVFALDFHISKIMQYSPQEKIRLFVAQKDNVETSACIISPPQVNFLVNGRGVNGRTIIYVDTGPQIPTNITHMLKLGSNLLQVVGTFNGHYVIAVAIMNTAPPPDSLVLQDYVQQVVSTVDSDSDIIEGPSRISLNCPISYTRMKVPVKGCSCKHLQCFDFYNFIDINSRRPSWRCPHCNQHICYLDIRVDQNMLKVLREVAENVTEVIISADGSWKAILENDNGDGPPFEDSLNHQNERTQQESTAPPVVLDLTEVDDDMNTICYFETEDRKPCLGDKSQLVSSSLNTSSGMNMNGLNQNFAADLDDDFWSGIVIERTLTSSTSSDVPVGNILSAPSFADVMQSAVFTDAVTPVNHGVGVHGHVALSSPALHDQNNFPAQVMNLNENNQYGRMTSIPRHVSRTPVAVQALAAQSQALAAQSQASAQHHSPRTSTISSAPQVGQSNTTNRDGLSTLSRDLERRQQFVRHHGDPHHVTNIAPFQRPRTMQNRDPQDRSFTPGQASTGIRPRPSLGLLSELQNPHLQQALNMRLSQLRNQIASNVQPSLPLPRTASQAGGGYGGAPYVAVTPNNHQHARLMVASQRAEMFRQSAGMPLQNPISRPPHSFQTTNPDGLRTPAGELRNVGVTSQPVPPSRPPPHSFQTTTPDGLRNVGVTSQPVPPAAGSVDPSSEQNWQPPPGRMRGSLTGRAYSAALSQLLIQPTQPVQSPRPSSNVSPSAPAPGAPPSTQGQFQ